MTPSPTTPSTDRVWLTSEDLASRFGVPLATIRKWRYEGTGPRGVKLGRHVRYALTAVVEFEESLEAAS